MVLLSGTTTIAAPTTQSPADRVGQGRSQLDQPRFTRVTNARFAVQVECNVTQQSCIWTYDPSRDLVPTMDEETEDLIAQLCTIVVMIMEDTSVRALMAPAIDPAERLETLIEIERDVHRCLLLLSAARALLT